MISRNMKEYSNFRIINGLDLPIIDLLETQMEAHFHPLSLMRSILCADAEHIVDIYYKGYGKANKG